MASHDKMTLGIDPDTHTTGVAITDGDYIFAVGCYRVPSKLKAKEAVPRMIALLKARLLDDAVAATGGIERVVVEGQQIYLGTSKAVPDAILRVAQVAGGAVAAALGAWAREEAQPTEILLPRPQEWKGTVPKDIHQARIMRKFAWEYEKAGTGANSYVRPLGGKAPKGVVEMTPINKSDWKHIVDAMGLAKWGAMR